MLTDEQLAGVESWARREQRGDVVAVCEEVRHLREELHSAVLRIESDQEIINHLADGVMSQDDELHRMRAEHSAQASPALTPQMVADCVITTCLAADEFPNNFAFTLHDDGSAAPPASAADAPHVVDGD